MIIDLEKRLVNALRDGKFIHYEINHQRLKKAKTVIEAINN